VAVMHAGTLSGVLSRAEATQDKILALALERTQPRPQPVGDGLEAVADEE